MVVHLVPSQVWVKVPNGPSPIAEQKSDEEHDTLNRSDGFCEAAESGTTDHLVPSNDSESPAILKVFDPSVPSAPTAMQTLGVVHETALRTASFFPADGADICIHCLPSQSQVRGFSPIDFGDVLVTAAPTAMQNSGETHDTLIAKEGNAPAGAVIADQACPFQETIRGAPLVEDEETSEPTPTQNLADTHDTPSSSPTLADGSTFIVDQVDPFHDSNKVSIFVADELEALDPTATQKRTETQATPSSSESLAEVGAGLTMDHLRLEGEADAPGAPTPISAVSIPNVIAPTAMRRAIGLRGHTMLHPPVTRSF